jgi:phosphate starvation-inducible protein PhoH
MYLHSFYASIDKIVGKENANTIKAKVQFEHVGFQRGNTFPEFSCVIVSELQNLTASEAHTYITRLPQSSKMFLNADSVQSDLGMKSGLNDFLESISGIDNCAIAILDAEKHQIRRKEIVEITKKYIEIQKRKGNFFVLDKNKFEYVEL